MNSDINVSNVTADKSNNNNNNNSSANNINADYHHNDEEVRIPLNSNIKNMELYEVSLNIFENGNF